MREILIAGVGNIFNGDDGFGVEVAQRMARLVLPPEVAVRDFGIRGIDLAYALEGNYHAVILVDAASTGEVPGTLSVIEPEIDDAPADPAEMSGHNLDPGSILRLLATLDRRRCRVLLVACEPLDLGGESGAISLSAPVAAAVDGAIRIIQQLIREVLAEEKADAAPDSLEVQTH